jgi:hypothetical protein
MYCNCGRVVENRDTGLCATCGANDRKADRVTVKEKTAVKTVSNKLAVLHRRYAVLKAKWLPGKMCCVFPHLPAVEPHHSAGRSPDGYYDEWALVNDIPLLLDVRWWKPVSREGHMKIEMNPEWAKEMGYSESRI